MVEIHANEQIYYVPVEDVRAFIDDVNARRQLQKGTVDGSLSQNGVLSLYP